MYWDIILKEVLNRKTLKKFVFTNFGAAGTPYKIEDGKDCYKKESKKSYHLGINFPGVYLSRREAECVVHLLRGKSLKGIGLALNLSPRTIEFYLKNVKRKLNCRTKFELIELILASEFLHNLDF